RIARRTGQYRCPIGEARAQLPINPESRIMAGEKAVLTTTPLPGIVDRLYQSEGGLAVKYSALGHAALMALVIVARGGWKWFGSNTAQAADVAQGTTGRAVPLYEVDAAWPKIPANMRIGDASSVAIDANDNVWILSRPRTLPANQARLAAPPVTIWN